MAVPPHVPNDDLPDWLNEEDPAWLRQEPDWMRHTPRWLVGSMRELRMHQNGGTHTAEEWRALCAACHHRCLCCKRKRTLTKDHIVPVLLGGSNDISNIQPLCRSCNSSKGARHIDYRRKD